MLTLTRRGAGVVFFAWGAEDGVRALSPSPGVGDGDAAGGSVGAVRATIAQGMVRACRTHMA